MFFSIALFLSASLLFVIQPIAAKVLLPVYGGSPAVWTVCMLFFQGLLLISYAYAWGLSRLKGRHTWKIVHGVITALSLIYLPLKIIPSLELGTPELQILVTLAQEMGLPLLVIGASAPLLQFAFSLTEGEQANDPYYLYVASNLGSLIALVTYPWFIERYFNIPEQFKTWTIIYLLYLGLLLFLFLKIRYRQPPTLPKINRLVTWHQKMIWIVLSFIPCSLMLGVTFFITTDIAATPLLWVIPLALYLLSFIITFARRPIISHAWVSRNVLFVLIFPITGFIWGSSLLPVLLLMVFHLTGFFMIALLCHGELIRRRPPARELTTFYFCLALGGVLAGLFNALLAPVIFSYPYEYPLVMLLGLLWIPIHREKPEWSTPVLVLILLIIHICLPSEGSLAWIRRYDVLELLALSIIVIWPRSSRALFISLFILFVFIFMPWFKSHEVLMQKRNFYGIKQVSAHEGVHALISHSTIHGFQVMGKEKLNGSIAYYGAVLPVMKTIQNQKESMRVMVLGLGTGIMACQFRKQDELVIVEIDQQVIDIAKNPNLFTYLSECKPDAKIIQADGRLAVQQARDQSFDVIVMDVFNSDAIPIHLLTQEAVNTYLKKIKPEGVILFNISNRYLNLLPILTAAGRNNDLIVLHKFQPAVNRLGQLYSEWVMLTMNEAIAFQLMSKEGWRFVADDNVVHWTDDYSNIIPLLKY
nr:fused MFS/spermidine synthase [Legionella yabuuchiae]